MSYTFSATGLPTGLSLVGSQILGTPSTPGNYTVTFTVFDGVTSVSSVAILTIAAAAVPIPFWKLILSADCVSYSLDSARAQLQAFAESGSYWLDSATISPLFVAESGSYALDLATILPLSVAESGVYWLDSVEAAIAESGSYSLDSAVAAPLVVAETGVYWLDSAVAAFAETGSYWLDSVAIARDSLRLDPISYTPQNNSDYTYYSPGIIYNMLKIADSDTSSGMMVSNSPVAFVHCQLSGSAYLNRLSLWNGSLFGDFDDAVSIKIFEGFVRDELGTPLYTATVLENQSQQDFDLSGNSAFNTSRTQITIVVRCTSTPYVSVREIQLRGQAS